MNVMSYGMATCVTSVVDFNMLFFPSEHRMSWFGQNELKSWLFVSQTYHSFVEIQETI